MAVLFKRVARSARDIHLAVIPPHWPHSRSGCARPMPRTNSPSRFGPATSTPRGCVSDTGEVAASMRFRIFHNPLLNDIANVGYGALPSTIAAKSDVLRRFSRAIVKSGGVRSRRSASRSAALSRRQSPEVTPAALATQTHLLTVLGACRVLRVETWYN
jgi:hypothetical protein